jgi:outer membrane protein TolC
MGRISCGIVLIVVALAGSRVVNAQTHAIGPIGTYDGAPLTLTEAVETAVARNPDVAALRRQLDVLKLRPGQERSLPPPMFEAQVWQWPVNSLNPRKSNFFMPMGTQDFPARGKRESRAALAEKDVALGETDIAMRERDVAALVKQSYVDLAVSRKAIEIHLAGADILRQLADVSQAKYAAGRISQQDVLKNVVELSKLHDDLIGLEEVSQLATARLNVLLQRPIDTSIGPLDDPHEQTLDASVEQLQIVALLEKPELKSLQQQVERAQAELAVAQHDYKPDYSLQGGYMLMPNQTDGLMAKVGITWTRAPWARGKVDLRVQEMTAAIEAAKARQAAAESDMRLAIQEAYIRAKGAERRAALLRTTILPQSQQTFDVSRVGYQSNQVDFLAILENQRMLLDSQLEYFAALGDFQHAIADLERVVGAGISPGMLRHVPGQAVGQ